jgi:glycopeptide antibiotics resistance protein
MIQFSRTQLLWVALAYTAFVVYGSLVPLDFRSLPWQEALARFQNLPWLTLGIEARADWVANILLFIPLAFLWLGVLWRHQSLGWGMVASLLVLLAAGLLSLAIEFIQIFFPPRTTSLNDLVAESLGALIGVAAWWLSGPRLLAWLEAWGSAHGPLRQSERWLVVWLVGLFLYNLLPLDLTLSPVELYHKFKAGRVVLVPFAALPHDPVQAVYELVTDVMVWMPVAWWWRVGGVSFLRTVAYTVGAAQVLEFLQLWVYSRVADVTDVLTAAGGGMLGAGMTAIRWAALPRWAWTITALAWLGILLGLFWYPFDFRSEAQAADEILRAPLTIYYFGTEFRAATEVLHKVLFFLPLGFCLGAALKRRWLAVVLGAGVAGTVEIGQLFLPTKYADFTDWALETAGVALGVRLAQGFSIAKVETSIRVAGWVKGGMALWAGLTLLFWLASQSAFVPYNVRELIAGEYPFVSAACLSFAVLWGVGLPVAVALASRRAAHPVRMFLVALPLHGLMSYWLLRLAVPMEALHDLVGSPTLGWPWEWELWGRFLGLASSASAAAFGAALLAFGAPPAMRWLWGGMLFPLLIFSYAVVVLGANTDNLVELLAHEARFDAFLWVWLAGFLAWLAGYTAGEWLVARRPRWALWYVPASAPLIWGLLQLGLESTLVKYGQVFSALQFLLSSDRSHYADKVELAWRFGLAWGMGVGLLALVSGWLRQVLASGESRLDQPKETSTQVRGRGLAQFLPVSFRFRRVWLWAGGVAGVVSVALLTARYSASHLPPDKASLLPPPEALPVPVLPKFRFTHPRLPAPSELELLTLKQRNPDYLRFHVQRAQRGEGEFYSIALVALAGASSIDLERVVDRLLKLQYTFRGHEQAMPVALIYDWLYPQLHSTQRQKLQEKLAEGCSYLADYIRKEALSPYNVYLYNRPLQALMAVALVLYGDHPQGAKCLAFAYDLWKNRVLPVWRQVMGKNGGWHEGGEYVGLGIGQAIWSVPAMWRAATGEDLFQTEPGLRGFLDFLVLRRRPDGTHMRWGDGAFFDRQEPERFALALEYRHRAAYSFFGCLREIKPTAWPWGPLPEEALCDPTAVETLPLEKLFDGIGMVIARSDFSERATYVTFKAGDNFWSHSHLDQGSFTLYKGGELILDSGVYGPYYGSDHHLNYAYQTIAHNVVTVTDPKDTAPLPGKDKKPPRPIANDGGQRRVGSGWGRRAPIDLAEWQENFETYHTGKLLRYFAGQDLVVAVADLTPAYTNSRCGRGNFSDRTCRVEKYWRTLVYDRQEDVVVVYDDVTATDPAFLKRFLLHMQERPRLLGDKFILELPPDPSKRQLGGRLEGEVLFPHGAWLNLVGGKGAEFWVDGKNYDEGGKLWEFVGRLKHPPEFGRWRIEIVPPVAQKRDRFLVVLKPALWGEVNLTQIACQPQDSGLECRLAGRRTVRLIFPHVSPGVTVQFGEGAGLKLVP